MQPIRARVRGGRLTVDEPTSLPDDTEIELVVASTPREDALCDAIDALRARPMEDFVAELSSQR